MKRKLIAYLLAFVMASGMLAGMPGAAIAANDDLGLHGPQAEAALYNAADIAVINAIISANSLDWPRAIPADGSYAPAEWEVDWSRTSENQQIVSLYLDYQNMTGILNVNGLTALRSLYCRFNSLTGLVLNSTMQYVNIDIRNNALASKEAITGPSNIIWDDGNFYFAPQDGPKLRNDITASIKDTNFRTIVRRLIGKPAPEPIRSVDVAGIRTLELLYEEEIKSLAGLEHFTSLQVLNAYGNELTSLPSLPSTLLQIDVSNNFLTTLPVLPSGLRALYCSNNRLTALPALPQSLRLLKVDGNRLTGLLDVSALSFLEELECFSNRLTSVALNYSAPYILIDVSKNYITSPSAVTGRTIAWGSGDFWFEPQNPACNHTPGSRIVTRAATCSEKEIWEIRCTECNVIIQDGESNELGHLWNPGVITIQPTCEVNGSETSTCSRPGCTNTSTMTIPAGHNIAMVNYKPATCEEASIWVNRCARCGEVFGEPEPSGEALGHAWSAWEETPATCEEGGVRQRVCANDPSHPEIVLLPALGHAWSDWVVIKSATFDTAGEETRTCANDPSHTQTRTIPPTGHNWGEEVVTKDATCEEPGEKTNTCDCDPPHVYTIPIPALGHAWGEWKEITPATCGEEGERQRVCANDASHIATEKIPATPHAWRPWELAFPATCEEPGEDTRTCANDPTHKETRAIEPLGHKYNEIVTPPTCDKAGFTTFICAYCDYTYTGASVAALGHKYGEWKVATPATCLQAGVRQRECENDASHIEQGPIPALDHDWDDGTITTPATASNTGIKTFTCKRPGCGETSTAVIPKLEPEPPLPPPVTGGPPTSSQPTPAPTPPPTQILPVIVPQAPFTNPFVDVASGAWYHSNVMHVYRAGLMTGTSATQFSPNVPTSRGMIVTILYRLSKSPAVGSLPNPFSDVAEGTWYTDAVKWAAANGIVSGLGEGRFGPTADVTREQLATILNNYANFTKMNLPVTGEYPNFADDKDIASYAKSAVERLSKAGIVGGKPGNNFDPRGNATRAEVASMLTRLTTAK